MNPHTLYIRCDEHGRVLGTTLQPNQGPRVFDDQGSLITIHEYARVTKAVDIDRLVEWYASLPSLDHQETTT